MNEHEWVEVSFSFGGWIECTCGYRPTSQEEMDAHNKPPVEECKGAFDMPLSRKNTCERCGANLEDHSWFNEVFSPKETV